MREEPIHPLPSVEDGTPTREHDHGVEPAESDADPGGKPVVWLPPDEE
jgi:hypothetical protein